MNENCVALEDPSKHQSSWFASFKVKTAGLLPDGVDRAHIPSQVGVPSTHQRLGSSVRPRKSDKNRISRVIESTSRGALLAAVILTPQSDWTFRIGVAQGFQISPSGRQASPRANIQLYFPAISGTRLRCRANRPVRCGWEPAGVRWEPSVPEDRPLNYQAVCQSAKRERLAGNHLGWNPIFRAWAKFFSLSVAGWSRRARLVVRLFPASCSPQRPSSLLPVGRWFAGLQEGEIKYSPR